MVECRAGEGHKLFLAQYYLLLKIKWIWIWVVVKGQGYDGAGMNFVDLSLSSLIHTKTWSNYMISETFEHND